MHASLIKGGGVNVLRQELVSDRKAPLLEGSREGKVFSTPESPEADIACGGPWWSQAGSA